MKYQAFLRKATRYNPTRGGKRCHLYLVSRAKQGSRSFPFPCSIPHFLPNRSWHDAAQNLAWRCCYATPKSFRRHPTSIRQEEARCCSSGSTCATSEARTEILHSRSRWTRIWMEVPGCGCKVRPFQSLIMSLRMLTRFRLEERRKVKGAAYYERKKAARKSLASSQKNVKLDSKAKKELASYGY